MTLTGVRGRTIAVAISAYGGGEARRSNSQGRGDAGLRIEQV
jgi:hypothetical protein